MLYFAAGSALAVSGAMVSARSGQSETEGLSSGCPSSIDVDTESPLHGREQWAASRPNLIGPQAGPACQ